MTMFAVVEGRVADPELRYTQAGKAVLELRIAATRRAKDKNTGEWADDGAALWVGATFWEAEAERIAETVRRGDTVTVTGDVVLDSYQRRDGTQAEKIVVRWPRFRGVVPKVSRGSTQAPVQPGLVADPYATPSSDAGAPF